jgi:hypothetical protein
MSGRLSNINNREHKVFKEYVEIIEDKKPKYIKTSKGVFDNRKWLEAETEDLLDERDRLEKTTQVNGSTIGVNFSNQ